MYKVPLLGYFKKLSFIYLALVIYFTDIAEYNNALKPKYLLFTISKGLFYKSN